MIGSGSTTGTKGCDVGVPDGLSEQAEGALEAGERAEAKAPQGSV